MGIHTDRWARADEEMKVYDAQLQQLVTSPLFLTLVRGTARPITDPKTQLFLGHEPKKVRRSRRNGV
jgi:hypothetical protein